MLKITKSCTKIYYILIHTCINRTKLNTGKKSCKFNTRDLFITFPSATKYPKVKLQMKTKNSISILTFILDVF